MLRAYRLVSRPYYWYRPAQLVVRMRAQRSTDGNPLLLRTAWGSHIYCWPDPLGNAVARTGVYDLNVAETLARLADRGETALDAGANVGFMSNLLAHSVGASGRVVCFEPHPLIFETLARNVARWEAAEQIETIELRRAAVSAQAGTLPLTVDPDAFAHNKGTASLEHTASRHADSASDSTISTQVETVRLDDELSDPVGVLKLDVEGHELAALRGAESLLRGGLIRDVLFEEHQPPPTPVTALLEAHGYTIFGVHQGISGPILSATVSVRRRRSWHPPALLATTEPERARRRLRRRGWICLRASFRQRA